MKKFTVHGDTTLKDFTDSTYPQGSFAYAALLRKSDIRVNGGKVNRNVRLKEGDEVVYYTTPAQEAKRSHSVIYADEHIYIADKESGVSSEALLSELCEKGRFYAVHRLDRNTCGLLVFARDGATQSALSDALKARRVTKRYLCIAKNNFRGESAVLTAYLKKDAEKSRVTVSDTKFKGYSEIVTEYRVIENLGDCALVSVTLHTGKTHQIRAHLAHIGCPVVGDEKYGDQSLNRTYGVKRQLLVAKSLQFHLAGDLSYLNGKVFESAFEPRIGRDKQS